ncbi:hypothetical protein GW750_03765 [bacterium]|nr:hypothetical protein [bacterium]
MFGLFPQGIVAPEHIGPGIQDDSTPMEIKNPEYPNVADALKALEELNKKEEQEKLALKEIEDKDLEVVFEEISDKFSIVKNLKSKSVQIRIALADVSKKGNYRILESDNFIKTTFSDILVS